MQSTLKIVLACLLAGFAAAAGAQAFPEKPVRVIIPYAPGGGTDNLVRTIAPTISASMGHQLIIENRPGGNSIIGTELVAKAPPDGYTVLATDTAVLVNPGLFRAKMPFDTAKSFVGVTMMAYAPVLLVVHPSVPANTLPELLALARAKPGYLNYASGGSGTSTHLAAELMKLSAHVFITHIPYKGTGPAMTDLLGGQVHMQFAGISSARSYVEAGKLRALAVTNVTRNPAMPNVPTFEELGIKNVDADSYWGVYAPAGTPPAVLAALNKHFVAAMRSPVHAERLASLGYLPLANTYQEHTQQMQAMIARWTDVIERLKIKAE